jgi:hypothetical protein
VLVAASNVIDKGGDSRTAPKALRLLSEHVDEIRQVVVAEKKHTTTPHEDFTFTYEEEADPEIFFVPYVWETIVCVATSSFVEWNKNKILIFPLLEEEAIAEHDADGGDEPAATTDPTRFSLDVSDVV